MLCFGAGITCMSQKQTWKKNRIIDEGGILYTTTKIQSATEDLIFSQNKKKEKNSLTKTFFVRIMDCIRPGSVLNISI